MTKKPIQKPFCPNCGRVGHPKDSDLIPLGDKTIDDINHIQFHTEYGLETLEELLRTSQFKNQLGKNFRPFKLFSATVFYRDSAFQTICAAYGDKLKVCRDCPDVALIGEKWLTERSTITYALRYNSVGLIKAAIKLIPEELKAKHVLPNLANNDNPDEIVKLISPLLTPTEKSKMLNDYTAERPGITDALRIVKFTRPWVETGIDLSVLKPQTLQYVVDYLPLEDQKKVMARIFLDVIRAN